MSAFWSRIFLLGSALGVAVCLILVSLTVWLELGRRPVFSAANVQIQYVRQFESIKQGLNSLIDSDFNSIDSAALGQLQAKLMSLTVPAEAREFHLSLVLKLKQLENLLTQPSADQAVSVERVQSELRTLVASHQW